MAHKMTVFPTVSFDCLAAIRRGYWLVTPFNNIARYVERMLSADQAQTEASEAHEAP